MSPPNTSAKCTLKIITLIVIVTITAVSIYGVLTYRFNEVQGLGREEVEHEEILTSAADFPIGSIPGSLELERLQPAFDFNLVGWFMGLEDISLQFNRADKDMFILQMMNTFYEQLHDVYTLEEIAEIPEVLELEDYLWVRLGVDTYIEDARKRLPIILGHVEVNQAGREQRIARNRQLLLDNVTYLRNDFNNSFYAELFDVIVTLTGLSQQEMTELVFIILEVGFYHRAQGVETGEYFVRGSLLRERVLETTVEGLWNSRSSMAFMALDIEYQPLLSLLVELVVAQIENMGQ